MEQNLEALLSTLPEERLREIYAFWDRNGPPPAARQELLVGLLQRMTDARSVEEKSRGLGRKLGELLGTFLDAPGFSKARSEIHRGRPPLILSPRELDAALNALVRQGLLAPQGNGGKAHDYAIPLEVGRCLQALQRRDRRGLRDVLFLKGLLESSCGQDGNGRNGSHLKESYKLLSEESAVLARIRHLPPDVRGLVEKAAVSFGGILPRSLFDRLALGPASWEGTRWQEVLEKNYLGTVAELSLDHYGIHHDEETLVLFQETTVAFLRAHAFKKRKPRASVASLGVDLISNIDRFITFVLENPVKFTVKGEIFRTTEKRITEEFLQGSCRELGEGGLLAVVYRFCLENRLIDRTGERTFALSSRGREWKGFTLEEKLRALLKFCCEERSPGADSPHQLRLRRIFLRWLGRLEPGEWCDAMSLPLLARNSYLGSLDQLQVAEVFAARYAFSSHAPMEDLQQMTWNLFSWVRRRLHPLGVVDLCYDRSKRPMALRLSRLGAQVLAPPAVEGAPVGKRAHVVINPDFEVVLFPTEDSYEIVHALDRFCVRTKCDRLYHYRLTEESVRRALSEGVSVSELVAWLGANSRVPVPQNVIYSIWDWAMKNGVLRIGKRNHISASRLEVLDRFLGDPRVKRQISSRPSENEAVLKRKLPVREIRRLVLDQGFFIDTE